MRVTNAEWKMKRLPQRAALALTKFPANLHTAVPSFVVDFCAQTFSLLFSCFFFLFPFFWTWGPLGGEDLKNFLPSRGRSGWWRRSGNYLTFKKKLVESLCLWADFPQTKVGGVNGIETLQIWNCGSSLRLRILTWSHHSWVLTLEFELEFAFFFQK